jgi:aryl carrier-like protein
MKVMNTAGAEAERVKIVVAGEAGNGKTSLAATIERGLGEKCIVVSAEAGLLSLRGSSVDFIELQTDDAGASIPKDKRIARLAEIYEWLLKPEQTAKYRWVFIDSLTEINQNMLELLDTQEEFQGPKNTIKKYGELSTRMMALAKTFRDMPHYSLVFTSLVKSETDADNQAKMKVAMVGSFADRLPALFDEILYLGVTDEVCEDGRNKRMLLTQKSNKIDFPKDRSGKLDRLEPADLSVVVKKIRKRPVVADISGQAKSAHQATKVAEVRA